MNLVPFIRFDNVTEQQVADKFIISYFHISRAISDRLRYAPLFAKPSDIQTETDSPTMRNGDYSTTSDKRGVLVEGRWTSSNSILACLQPKKGTIPRDKILGVPEEAFYVRIRADTGREYTTPNNKYGGVGVNSHLFSTFSNNQSNTKRADNIITANDFQSRDGETAWKEWTGSPDDILPYISVPDYVDFYVLCFEMIFVSLSKVFGLGNEPDLAWCQENITYDILNDEKEEQGNMSRIVWDADTERRYETGVDHGVLYLKDSDGKYNNGVPWNGLTGVTQSPSGSEPTALWADNIKYLSIKSAEEFGCTIEAYTYPPEFNACNGLAELAKGITIGQQKRSAFGFCYRSILGNDAKGEDFGYKLHLIYGCEASPSESSYATKNDSPDAINFSWSVTTTPVVAGGNLKPTALLEIDSTEVDPVKLQELEDILYGKNGTGESDPGVAPRLPLPSEIATLFAAG